VWPVELLDGSEVDVVEGKSGGNVVWVGMCTLEQRPVAFELTQQESVALGELVEQ
jgi:hypothetical protein